MRRLSFLIVFLAVLSAPCLAAAAAKPATAMVLDGVAIPSEYSGGVGSPDGWTATGRQGIGKVSVEMHLGTLGSENVTSPLVPLQHLLLPELAGTAYGLPGYMTPGAPGGAFGWMTPQQEQWYGNMRWNYTTIFRSVPQGTKAWHRYRKFLVTNLVTGRMVVCVAGDYGPGVGSRIGGLSPDAMFWASNQPGLVDHEEDAPSTPMGYDSATDYLFEWVLDDSVPAGPVRPDDRKPTNIAVFTADRMGSAYGGTVTLAGVLAGAGGRPVPLRLQGSPDGVSWASEATVGTAADGSFSAPVSPRSRRLYRLAYAGDAGHYPVTSRSVTVLPRALLGGPSVPPTAYYGRTFAVRVSLRPRHRAGTRPVTLLLQRYERRTDGSSGWVTRRAAAAVAYDYRSYSRTVAWLRLSPRGRWRVRGTHADAGHAASSGPWAYFTVR